VGYIGEDEDTEEIVFEPLDEPVPDGMPAEPVTPLPARPAQPVPV
jgi:hypothetical protein